MSARWVTFDCYGTLVDWQSGFTAKHPALRGTHAPFPAVRVVSNWQFRKAGASEGLTPGQ